MISVIIPVLNEREIIRNTLSDLLNREEPFEIVVSDGGSSDGTLNIISRFSEVKQVRSPRGRARQMNEGAKAAQGDIYLFLHADTRLPQEAGQMIETVMTDSAVAAGSFSLSFDYHSFSLRLYALLSRINHGLFTYGDQGLFLSARTFEIIGGFDDLPIMEDVDIQKRLRRQGKFIKLKKSVVTSARRFVARGIIRQQVLNTALVFLYHLGFSPSYLKRFYR